MKMIRTKLEINGFCLFHETAVILAVIWKSLIWFIMEMRFLCVFPWNIETDLRFQM